ncbi:MAG: bacteriohemerythrin [Gammaproteobacteria bacterium]|nr:bacteriohemerythrin [Gammaproteobacteria bacterium]
MAYIDFNQELHVGSKVMDQEHAVLIRFINMLHECTQEGHDDKTVGTVLTGLLEYTRTHFFVEEELMHAYEYPKYKEHKSAHDTFKSKVVKLNDEFQRGDMQITSTVLEFLKQWLTEHILKVDRELARHLNSVGMA